MGGKGPEVLVTLTTDFGKVLDGIHRTKIRGTTHLATGIQIAGVRIMRILDIRSDTDSMLKLALKHRQNKSQRQRIIVFTCSPIYEDEKTLIKLAKKMKKNNVSIDFVAFGDLEPENTKKLEAFNENIKGGDGSHLAVIPPGPSLLSDHLVSSPILAGDGVAPRGEAGMDGGTGGGGGDFEFDVDPSTDPELALALRMSMEEEKARVEKEGKPDGAKEPTLEGIPEEGGENQPLLNKDGEASGSGETSKPDEVRKDNGNDKKEGGEGGGDKMDTT